MAKLIATFSLVAFLLQTSIFGAVAKSLEGSELLGGETDIDNKELHQESSTERETRIYGINRLSRWIDIDSLDFKFIKTIYDQDSSKDKQNAKNYGRKLSLYLKQALIHSTKKSKRDQVQDLLQDVEKGEQVWSSYPTLRNYWIEKFHAIDDLLAFDFDKLYNPNLRDKVEKSDSAAFLNRTSDLIEAIVLYYTKPSKSEEVANVLRECNKPDDWSSINQLNQHWSEQLKKIHKLDAFDEGFAKKWLNSQDGYYFLPLTF